MDTTTFATTGIIILVLVLFLANYLHFPDLRKNAINYVFFAFAALLIFSSFKMLFTGEMGSFNTQEGEVKIFAATQPLQFWGSLIFKMSLGGFILYSLYLKTKK